MGNALAVRRRLGFIDDNFNIGSLFGDINGILTPTVPLPLCLDELIDWSSSASTMVSYLQENDRGSPLCRRGGPRLMEGDSLRFVPRKRVTSGNPEVKELPSKWIEAARILTEQIVVVVESRDKGDLLYCMTGFQFCKYHALLCQLTNLMTLDVQARSVEEKLVSVRVCTICQSQFETFVCSCSQGVCSKCQEKWVQQRLNCPFCRTRFANRSDIDNSQWQLTEWNQKLVERDIAAKLQEERDFWLVIPLPVTEEDLLKKQWDPLKRSIQQNRLENDFLLL